MVDDDDIVQAFLVESAEGLDELDRDLVALERDPSSRERLASIFRTIHSIKGTSGFLAFSQLERLAHSGESLLSRLRDGDLVMTPPIASVLLAMVDQLRGLLDVVASTGTDDVEAPGLAQVVAALDAATAADAAPDAAPDVAGVTVTGTAAETPAEPAAHADAERVADSVVEHVGDAVAGPVDDPAVATTPQTTPQTTPEAAAEPVVPAAHATEPAVVAPEAAAAPPTTPQPTPQPAPQPVLRSPEPPVADGAGTTSGASAAAVADASVRVDVELLDTLVRLVGELVLTRNQIVQQAAGDPDQARTAQRLNVVASELQASVMLTRMQPIGQAWTKFPRIVRDLATQLGKDVRLETTGQETELDRSLLDAIKDPLTHLVRNAIDHGVESPAVRTAGGKPAQGVLSLSAHHESGQVVVEVADDGAGLDAARIGEVAVARGVVSATDAARMSDRELVELIFRPGFSTAAAVTNVSGRGVGMDVVRTNIERIGGVVDVSSRPGRGTTFRVRIPLTLAIIPALVVSQAGDRYAIPQASLVELVRWDQVAGSEVEEVAGAQLLRLRDQLLPLVSLSDALRPADGPATAEDRSAEATVVVVQADGVRFGLVVDEVHDTQEIVVKPLGRQLKQVPVYAGATIMGEGRVALILNISGVADTVGISAAGATSGEVEEDETADEATALLVLDLGDGHRAAMPLARVSRLEEVSSTLLERTGEAEAVQYRDGILPLVRLADRIGLPHLARASGPPATGPGEEPTSFPVVVHGEGAHRVGLVAERILDLVETVVVASPVGARPGVLGTAVVQDRITDLIDVDAVVGAAGLTVPVAAGGVR